MAMQRKPQTAASHTRNQLCPLSQSPGRAGPDNSTPSDYRDGRRGNWAVPKVWTHCMGRVHEWRTMMGWGRRKPMVHFVKDLHGNVIQRAGGGLDKLEVQD